MTSSISPLEHTASAGRAGERSAQGLARLAGTLYLVIAVVAIVAHAYVPAQLLAPDAAAASAINLRDAGPLLRLGIGAETIILICEIALSILLYLLLRPVSKALSLVAAVFRLAMTTIHAVNLLNYFCALILLSGASYLATFSADQTQALALLFISAHRYGFAIGIFFFVPHVFVLGYLIIRSGYLPRILGALFLLAACGYLVDSMALLLVPGYGPTPAYIALPIAVAEVAFPIWLLARGVDAERWRGRAPEAA